MSVFSAPAPLKERLARGRALRHKLKRVDLALWSRPEGGPDPMAILHASNAGRVPRLVPLKMGRMQVSPFSYFRGSAPAMAADLATQPVTGITVQLCGDAHVRNLGAYAAPDGHLVFDLNDFDEAVVGPWEWDLKRLATSIVLCGREAGLTDGRCSEAVQEMALYYREAMADYARMHVLELARFEIRRELGARPVRTILQKAQRSTPLRVLEKLTLRGPRGLPRFHDQPPVLEHVPAGVAQAVLHSLKMYRETLTAGRQLIFDAYHPMDVAFKVVGTGSVGTRDYIVLLFGNGLEDPLFLQVKEALPSCYETYLPEVEPIHCGQRVAQAQQRCQTVSDPFLGWTTLEDRHYLVRQLSDHKAAIDTADLQGPALAVYSHVCGETLAKAHARTGDSAALAGYCGTASKLDGALAKFALLYADQTEKDFATFRKEIRAGRIKAEKISA